MSLTLNAIHRHGNPRCNGQKRLERGKFILGRAPESDWLLEDDAMISKQHCVLESEAEFYTVQDFSTNGTYLNGNLVGKGNKAALADGDCLEVGEFAFRIEISNDLPLAGDPLAGLSALPDTRSEWLDADLGAAFGSVPSSGAGIKSLLDDIAASGVTAESILPGSNDTSLPYVNAPLDIDKEINPVGWNSAPEPEKQEAVSGLSALDDSVVPLKRPVIPQRDAAVGLNTVLSFKRRNAILPDDWANPASDEEQENAPVVDALDTELKLIRAFARAANLGETEIRMLTSSVQNGWISAEQLMAHAGGLFRQTAAAIEERLGSIRAKAQSLEYLLPNQAYEQLEVTLKQTAVLDLKTAAGNVSADLIPASAGGRQQDMLSHIIEDMHLIDNALFTTLLTVSAFVPKSPAGRHSPPDSTAS